MTIIYGDNLPANSVMRRISGDWLENGYISNLNRPQKFECVIRGDQVFEVDNYGNVDFAHPLPVVDGEIQVRGRRVTFLPRGDELTRVGLAETAAHDR